MTEAAAFLLLADSILDKPFPRRNALVYRHWSDKYKEVVSGITLITLQFNQHKNGWLIKFIFSIYRQV